MSEESKNDNVKKWKTLTRREFLKNTGIIVGGIGAVAFLNSCAAKTVTSTATTTAAPSTVTTTATKTATTTAAPSTVTTTATTTATKTTTPTNPVVVKEWAIPMICSLTGSSAAWSVIAQWYINYAVGQINAAGGISGVPLKVSFYDDAGSPTQAVSIAANVISSSLLMLGPTGGTTISAVSQQVLTAKILDIGSALDPSRRTPSAPYTIAPTQDVMPCAIYGGKAWLDMYPNFKKIALFYFTDLPYDFSVIPTRLAAPGRTFDMLGLSLTQTDFSPQVTKAIADGCDAFMDMGSAASHISIGQALFNRGVTQGTEIWASNSIDNPSLFTAGKGYLENSYLVNLGNPFYTGARFQQLVTDYTKATGQDIHLPQIGYYDAMFAIKNAFETLGITGDPLKLASERDQLAKYLYNSPPLTGVQGPYQFSNGEDLSPFTMLQIKNNQYIYVSTIPNPG
jgi:branched-chain amino acid transport system substrate-binding protein